MVLRLIVPVGVFGVALLACSAAVIMGVAGVTLVTAVTGGVPVLLLPGLLHHLQHAGR